MWHCPHCGTPQAETARCWVCRRSSTTCSTCRHFRPALSADLGYCALDVRRLPLTGLEHRGCWEERIGAADRTPTPVVEPHRLRASPRPWPWTSPGSTEPVPMRGFVPLELLGQLPDPAAVRSPAGPAPAAAAHSSFVASEPEEDWSGRTSLFGDGEG